MSVRPGLALTVVLAFAAPAAATLPQVDPVSVQRSASDLVLTWPAVAGATGYRVYRSSDVACTAVVLLYEGPDTRFLDPGALADPQPALYGVAAFAAGQRGPTSAPVYKYMVEALPLDPYEIGGTLVSFPERSGTVDPQALCLEVNGIPRSNLPLDRIARFASDQGFPRHKFCTSNLPVFPLGGGEAYLLMPRLDPTPVVVYGAAAATPLRDLPLAHEEGTEPCLGLYWLSLPYDHAYPDLASLAAALPRAVRVEVHDPRTDVSGPPCQATRGLRRASPSQPWSGENLSLLDRRGEGVVLAVDRPSRFVPRRLCTRFGGSLAATDPVVLGPGRPTVPTGGGGGGVVDR